MFICEHADKDISIHAPREGCDMVLTLIIWLIKFQSTHPVRGAT